MLLEPSHSGATSTYRSQPTARPWAHLPQEFQEMLDREPPMTIGEAIEHHREHWGFSTKLKFTHELTHLVLGMAGVKPYQATWDAEIYNVMLENCLKIQKVHRDAASSFDTPSKLQTCVNNVMANARVSLADVNLDRTLTWLEARQLEKPQEWVRKSRKYDDIEDISPDDYARYGIKELDTLYHGQWQILTTKGELFTFDKKDPDKCSLPSDLYPYGGFVPFSIPNPNVIQSTITALAPMMIFLEKAYQKAHDSIKSQSPHKPADLDKIISQIPIRELYAALHKDLPPLHTDGPARGDSVIPDAPARGKA